MLEAEKGFRRLKAHKQLSILSAALLRHRRAHVSSGSCQQKSGNITSDRWRPLHQFQEAQGLSYIVCSLALRHFANCPERT